MFSIIKRTKRAEELIAGFIISSNDPAVLGQMDGAFKFLSSSEKVTFIATGIISVLLYVLYKVAHFPLSPGVINTVIVCGIVSQLVLMGISLYLRRMLDEWSSNPALT
jgi:hypothetical protein